MKSVTNFSRRWELKIAIVLLLILGLPAVAHAIAKWATPINVTNNSYMDSYPHLVSEGSSRHLLGQQISSYSDTTVSLYYRKKVGSNSWSSPALITSNGSFGSSLCASSGKAFVAYDAKDGGDGDIFFRTNRTGSWSAPKNLTNNSSAEEMLPDIAQSGSSLFIAFERDTASTDSELFFTRSSDNGQTWSAPAPFTSNTYDDYSPQVVSYNGRWYVVWSTYNESTHASSIRYRTFYNGSWTNERIVASSSTGSLFGSVIDMRNSTPCIAYSSFQQSGANGIRFAYLNSSGSWVIRNVTSNSSFSTFDMEPSIDVAPNGVINIAWSRFSGQSNDVWNAAINTPAGTIYKAAVTSTSTASEYSADIATDTNSNCHIVYSRELTGGLPDLFYGYRTGAPN